MPTLDESRRHVRETLDKEIDHGDILASLQDEIDQHNAAKEDGEEAEPRRTKRTARTSGSSRDEANEGTAAERSMKFRFKAGASDPRVRRHRSRPHEDKERHRRKRRKHARRPSLPADSDAAHPFPREPADPDAPAPVDAFRDSLFDALADDEGAQYWESVYSQPIHIYPRPSVETEKGVLEQMNDDEYAAYVKTKMWERKHPEEVLEREKTTRQKKAEEEDTRRRREEFVRRRERAAWERAEQRGARRYAAEDDEYEYAVPKDWDTSGSSAPRSSSGSEEPRQSDYEAAWARYLAAWDRLKRDLLHVGQGARPRNELPAAQRIPWPVVNARQPVTRLRVESFMRHAPADGSRSRQQLLKAERVRWHPDKIQQRFGGQVDEATMKLVTELFQVIDALFEEERGRQR